jgi:hypothetical protein
LALGGRSSDLKMRLGVALKRLDGFFKDRISARNDVFASPMDQNVGLDTYTHKLAAIG